MRFDSRNNGSGLGPQLLLELRDTLFGDYDLDGDVDLSDYVAWSATFGSTTQLNADGNDNGIVDAADYVIWRDVFNNSAQVVPEPSGAVLAFAALLAVLRVRRRRTYLFWKHIRSFL